MDRSLFSTEIPDGYRVIETQVDASAPTEETLVAALRICSRMAGEFPAGLDAVAIAGYVGKLMAEQGVSNDNPPGKDLMQQVSEIARGFRFALLLPPEADAHYAGAKVTPGDSKAPVFWYKPAGADAYRVIYSDLTVQESKTRPQVDGASKLKP